MMEEAGVGFVGGEMGAIDVEGSDFVAVCASAFISSFAL